MSCEPRRGAVTPDLSGQRRRHHFAKKNNRRTGQMRGHDSPDRRQWIKSGPKIESGHTPVSLRARSKARRAPPRPRSSAPKAAGAFRKKTNPANRNRPAPWPPARPGKSGAALGTPRQWIKSGPKNESEHTTMPSAACVAVMRSTAVVVSFIMPWQPYSPGQRCGRLFIADAMYRLMNEPWRRT